MTGNQQFRETLKREKVLIEVTRQDFSSMCNMCAQASYYRLKDFMFKYENDTKERKITVREANNRIDFMKMILDLEDKKHSVKMSIRI